MEWSRQLFIGGALCLSAVLGGARHFAVAQDAAQPGLNMAALQLPTGTRYTVTVLNATQTTLGNLQVSVQLPADAVFDHALETTGFTQFQGAQGSSLSWIAASFAPDDIIDAFTFFLQQPSSGAFSVGASWDGDNAGQVQGQFQPVVQQAVETDADVTIDTSIATPVGNTGVVIAAVSGQVPAGTTVHIRVLSADNNPPAGTGDLWWCSQVSVDGLPAGAGLVLQVPARQPLPPQAPISLFTQNGAQWDALADAAQVTGDGQAITYVHRGGVVAAGTKTPLQPVPSTLRFRNITLATPTPLLSLPTGIIRPKIIGILPPSPSPQLTPEMLVFQLMKEPADCAVQNCSNPAPGCGTVITCAPFPACAVGAFVGISLSTGVSFSLFDACANKGGGLTECFPGGVLCDGTVPLTIIPGSGLVPAGPGHGFQCSGPSYDQKPAGSWTCTQF